MDPTRIDRRHKIHTAAEWIGASKWVGVKSSNVSAIMYFTPTKRLYVEFLPSKKFPQGSVYFYKNVPAEVAKGLFEAESIGKYLNRTIKGIYSFEGPFSSRAAPDRQVGKDVLV
jgi:hypothetical protein